MNTSTCKGCGKQIYLAVDESGKKQVLDAVAPTYVTVVRPDGMHCHRALGTFVSHVATCSAANQFSQSTKKKGSSAVNTEPSPK